MNKRGRKMPEKGTKVYIGKENDGTVVYWKPRECTMEYHKPDGTIEIKRPSYD